MKFHFTPPSSTSNICWAWKEGFLGRPIVLGMILKQYRQDSEKAYLWRFYRDAEHKTGCSGFASTRGKAAQALYDEYIKHMESGSFGDALAWKLRAKYWRNRALGAGVDEVTA